MDNLYNVIRRTLAIKTLCLLILPLQLDAQGSGNASASAGLIRYLQGQQEDIYGTGSHFIENIGQYGAVFERFPDMDTIRYAYEGFGVPVLFTDKGLILLHRRIETPELSEAEREAREKKEKRAETEAESLHAEDHAINMEWLNTSGHPVIVAESPSISYLTYGYLPDKARMYKRLTVHNLYPGIDIVYTFRPGNLNGFEYSLVVQPGADPGQVKMRYGGDVRSVKTDANGNLVIRSDIGSTQESIPVSYYGSAPNAGVISGSPLKTGFSVSKNQVGFVLPDGYDAQKTLIIDPFVTSTSNLTGTGVNAGVAKDVDFDYAGNVYVTGGGNGSVYKLAKYDASGVLQWTFNGALTIPSWNFGTYYGGWVVEKTTGNVYLGQGFAPAGGHRVIRINTTGIYDNYITTANPSFLENWKMYWNCNNGSPQLFIAGGGTNSNINFGVCSPPSTIVSSLNVTGIPYSAGTGWAQDISDVIIDPANNALFTIYGSLYGTPSLSNKIFRNNPPYSGASVAWSVYSGFVSIQEIANRPYLVGPEIDNSSNVLAINSSYLFYWDGRNLEAIDKNTGAVVGTPLTLSANTKLMSGGVIADECNNIFCGSSNGTIKVFYFNGSTFDDAAKPDISIPGFPNSSVYDLAFYESQKMLYASGFGFVGSFDVSSYNCSPNYFTVNVNGSCATLTATASLSPAPPSGSIVTYVLYQGATQLATNTTGIFTGLSPNTTYGIKAIINQVCSGYVTNTSFSLPGPTVSTAVTQTVCGQSNGAITITANGGSAPYTYSKDGTNYQAGNIFSGLSAGFYTVTAKDVNGCYNTVTVNVRNSDGPGISLTKTDAVCGSNTGTVTATGSGTAPISYSINGTTFQTNNFFTGILPGTYTLTVKDGNGCINAESFTINNAPGPVVSAIPQTTYCNTANGGITVIATGGSAPLEYSINANTYQSSNVFTGLAGGAYTVTVKDANGCLGTVSATVPNSTGPTVSATTVTASCSNANGSITATGSGGVAPLQYSINGITFQSANFFYGLTAGTYIVTVKDANTCTSTASVTVGSTNGPVVSGTSVASSCSSNTGSITASGSGGTGALQYSINGTTFQASTLFSGLAPNTYTLFVRDANGCLGAALVTVPSSTPPSVSAGTTSSSCGASDGMITASGTGGTAPYQYSLDGTNYQAGNTFSGLAPGSYTVYIKDLNGCSKSTAVTLNNVAGLSLNISILSSSCSSNNGSISATGSGGTAPLQYSINGTTYQSGNMFSGLAGGNYTVYVKDASGCVVSKPVTISTLLAPSLTVSFTDATCNGNNGSITLSGSGGTAPYLFSIDGTTYQSSGIFINVPAGTRTVYLKDAANCIQSSSVTIANNTAGSGITTFTVRVNYYPCNNNTTGDITSPRVNGSNCATCTFSLNNGPFVANASPLFTGLTPGNTYTITAKDVNGCTKTIFTTISPSTLSYASAIVTGTTCNGASGSIKLTGIGPKTPYHASISGIGGPWITFDPNYTFTGLSPGTYEIILSDDESFDSGPPIIPGGCLDTIYVTVPSTDGPSLTTTRTHGSCRLNDGTITASGSGGTGVLSYSIDGFSWQPDGDFSGLGSGIYEVMVMDENGCINSRFDTIVNPNGPSVSAVPTSAACGLPNGIITATGSGGTAPLQYSINGTVYQSSNVFSGLTAGPYTVRVGDASQCIASTTVTITTTAKPAVSAYAITATCNNSNGSIVASGSSGTPPYQYSLDGITFQSSNTFGGLDAGLYTVTLKDARGCLNTTNLSMPNLGAPTVVLAATPATCLNANGTITATGSGGTAPLSYSINDITYQGTNIFSGLYAGSYTVYVRDANGCKSSKNILVTSPNIPQSLSATVTHASCGNSNGSLVASASGGVAPLQYSINGTTYQASTSFTGLTAGTYPLTVKDANGCTRTLNVTISGLAGPTVSASSTLSSCFAGDGTITAEGSGGTGALTYSKNGTTFQSSPIFTGLAPGTYTITVKDTKGCTATDTGIVVSKVTGPTISVSDTLTGCGGQINASATGGIAPYQFNINNQPYQDSGTFSCQVQFGLTTVHVIDANGCMDSISFLFDSSAIGLPIELIAFTGRAEGNRNRLEWSTATEVNSDYFLLERSPDGMHFEFMSETKAAGNSQTPKPYSAIDDKPFPEITYYRLKSYDLDGSWQLSRIIHLHAAGVIGFYYAYNPDTRELTVLVNGLPDDQKHIELFDVTGNLVFSSLSKDNSYKISTMHFAAGMYLLRIKTESAEKNIKLEIY